MQTISINAVNELFDFLNTSPTSFHASHNISNVLSKKGFVKLLESEKWKLKKQGKYFVERNNSAVVAFIIGSDELINGGFNISTAHTDSPALKIKHKGLVGEPLSLKLNIEVYGGAILSTWLDRPLSFAGRVIFKKDGKLKHKLINYSKHFAVVPNLAIHLNREVNKGFEYNPHNHLSAIYGLPTNDDKKKNFYDVIAKEVGCKSSELVASDLYLYESDGAKFVGMNQEFISSSRLDNLAMCHAILTSLTEVEAVNKTCVAAFFDNEEIGSTTYQGADSSFIEEILERIVISNGNTREDYFRTKANSFLVSADMAHAIHPNFSDKHDPQYAPVINGGPVIKANANFRYATDGETTSKFIECCLQANVPFQYLANRADIPAGSTVGPCTTSRLSIKGVDVGNPMWAMHSIRETAGVSDHVNIIKALLEFYKN